MTDTPLRAAIIGLGVGERHIHGYASHPDCRVMALCDSDPEKLRQVGQRHPHCALTTDPDQVLQDPAIDIVSIASYDNAHAEQVLMALEHNKHVFVEKPLCLFESEYNAIAAALAARPHLKLSSNLILRRVPRFRALRERLRAGALGKLYYLEGDYDYGRLHKLIDGWRGRIPYYSVVHGGAIHLIDLLLWLTGEPVTEVFAYGNRITTRDTPFQHNDCVVALLKFNSGLLAKISANFASVTPHHHQLKVYGAAGTFVQSHTGAAYLNSRDLQAPMEAVTDDYPGTDKGDMLPAFIQSVRGLQQPEVTADEVLAAMAVALAIEASVAAEAPQPVTYNNLMPRSTTCPLHMPANIPFGQPMIGEEERRAVLEVLSGSILVHGPRASQFEQDFAAFTGAEHAVSVASCTAGMHLLYFALGIGPGDEVIVPAQTHVATAHAVELTGARAVFVDSDLTTGNIAIDRIEAAISPRTRAIAVVHYLGVPVDMPPVVEIARCHGLFLLEDCALALGARLDGRHVGLHGDAGVFSFYPVKHLTTAEGGMVITRDAELAKKLSQLKAFGVDRSHDQRQTPGLYDAPALGFNYRMSELHAAIGIEQLKKLPAFLRQRQANFQQLSARLSAIAGLRILPQPIDERRHSSHYCLNLQLSDSLRPQRPAIMAGLARRGIGCSIYYPHPVPRMSYYRTTYGDHSAHYPNAARISDAGIALPVGPHLDHAAMERIADAVAASLAEGE